MDWRKGGNGADWHLLRFVFVEVNRVRSSLSVA